MKADDKELRYVGILTLCFSIIASGMITLYVGNASAVTVLFTLWVVMPYIGLIFGDVLIRRTAIVPKITRIYFVISILLVIFTLYCYTEVIGDRSSTSGLVFLFLPFYANIMVIFLVVGGLFWASVTKCSKNEES